MSKTTIGIFKRTDLKRICLLCEREVYSQYYDIDVEVEDNIGNHGKYRHLCNDCHCSLKKCFTGVD